MKTVTIDLDHNGLEGAIACYLVLGTEPALVDPGPTTCLDRLEAGLARAGVAWTDICRLFLTHVHLDHAGATGHIAARAPHVEVVVHEDGAPHMVDPERLVKSTRRTFGDAHDALWGDVLPVPESRVTVAQPGPQGVGGLRVIPTPGHTPHHLAYLDEAEGRLFAGDSLGIILDPAAPTHPATPPPGVDVEAWTATLHEIAHIGPEEAAVTHFGIHNHVSERARELDRALGGLVVDVKAAKQRGDAEAGVRYEERVRSRLSGFVDPSRVHKYFDAFKAESDWAGMQLYLDRLERV